MRLRRDVPDDVAASRALSQQARDDSKLMLRAGTYHAPTTYRLKTSLQPHHPKSGGSASKCETMETHRQPHYPHSAVAFSPITYATSIVFGGCRQFPEQPLAAIRPAGKHDAQSQ